MPKKIEWKYIKEDVNYYKCILSDILSVSVVEAQEGLHIDVRIINKMHLVEILEITDTDQAKTIALIKAANLKKYYDQQLPQEFIDIYNEVEGKPEYLEVK